MSIELAYSVTNPEPKNESGNSTQVSAKLSPNGFALVPQPSEDVKDPLVCAQVFHFDFTRHASPLITHAF